MVWDARDVGGKEKRDGGRESEGIGGGGGGRGGGREIDHFNHEGERNVCMVLCY